MKAANTFDMEEQRSDRLSLVGLLAWLGALGACLYLVAGPPHLPPAWPSVGSVLATLRGSEPPLDAMGYLLTTAAWLVWLWIVGSLALRFAVVVTDALSHGARWARALRGLSDRVTLPIVRRVVDGALVAIVVVHLVGRAPTVAAAEPIPPSAVAEPRAPAPSRPSAAPARSTAEAGTIPYTVQDGDSLWRISELVYGTGVEYKRLVAANVGRSMSAGERFDAHGVIKPGWVLAVPLPGQRLERHDGATYYVVEEGDMLRGIAARFLGDEMKWPTIFELNHGTARLADGRTLKDPDLIWPGLRLRMPGEPTPRPLPELRAPDRDDTTLRRPASPPPPAPAPQPPTSTPEPARPTVVPKATPIDATATAVLPTPVPTPAVRPASNAGRSLLLYGVGGAVGLAALGGAAFASRRVRRSLDEPPIPDEPAGDAVLMGGYAEADLARALAHRLHGGEADAATLIASRVRRFYAERGIDLGIVTVEQGRKRTALTVEAKASDQARFIELAPELGARLTARARAEQAEENDVLIELAGMSRAGLPPADGTDIDAPWLLPVGALPSREILYVDWRELGHVLVAGRPGEGAETVLTSLVAALAARCRPEELEVWTVARRQTLPPEIGQLPHQRAAPVDPDDHAAVRAIVGEVRAELERRMNAPETPRPTLVLLLGEVADLADESLINTIGEYGPAHRVHVLAATTRPRDLDDGLLEHFTTRAVLRLDQDGDSIRLLRVASAEDLGGGGDMLLRVDARAPVHLRGFRVSAQHLAELLRLMRGAYAAPAAEIEPPQSTAAGTPGDGAAPGDVAAQDPDRPTADESEAPPMQEVTEEVAIDEPTPGFGVEGGADGVGRAPVVSDLGLPITAAAAHVVNGVSPNGNGHLAEKQALADAVQVEHVANGSTADPPLEVVCFGGPRLLYRGSQIWPPDRRGRFKHWEVLVFLAAQPTGSVPKGTLSEAVWPESEPAPKDPTHALRNQLWHLRQEVQELAPDVPGEFVVLQRSGQCLLDTSVVSSDVHRFVALCEEAKTLPDDEAKAAYRQARALYGGDLLIERPYEWLDERDDSGLTLREIYREMYLRATKELADLLLRDGEPASAVPLYRELLSAQPGMESLVRALFRCYRRLGDKSGLIREERHLRQVLQEIAAAEGNPVHAEPEPKTSALFQQVLDALEARETAGAGAPR